MSDAMTTCVVIVGVGLFICLFSVPAGLFVAGLGLAAWVFEAKKK